MLSPIIQRRIVLDYYRFDQTQDGLVRAEDFDTLALRVADNLGVSPGSPQHTKLADAYRQYWETWFKLADADGDDTVTLVEYLAAEEAFRERPGIYLYGKL